MWSKDGKPLGYYFFDADGESGRTAGLENGTGVGFSFKLQENSITISLGSADNTATGTVAKESDEKFSIRWENGEEEFFSYISGKGSDSFTFYTDDDLCKMAIAYYVSTENSPLDTTTVSVATESNSDSTVTIQVYQNLGDHNSNLAWYCVDRLTAQGKDDMSGKTIDLTQVSDQSFYSVCTTLSKEQVESFAAAVRQNILDKDWKTHAAKISYPITVGDTVFQSQDEFLAADIGSTLTGNFIKAIDAEDCKEMFCNWQGIMFASGEVWISEVLNEDGSSKGLMVIGINITD